ncbi:MAG: minichromosome maintenance protein MCM [Kosmotogaceae bacterium]
METEEIIEGMYEVIKTFYETELLENIRKGKKYIIIDYNHISRTNILLADELLNDPEDFLKAAEVCAERFTDKEKNIIIRIKNLPKTQNIRIRDLRSEHIEKLICIEGVIRQKSEIRPQVTSSKFECPSCGNIIPVLQLDNKFKEPTRCGCGRKGRFKILSKELIDAQNMRIEEDLNSLQGGEQPQRINIIMKQDLITPMLEQKAYPGSKIRINGFLKETPIILRNGGKSTRFDWILETNYFEPVEEEFGAVKISDEEKNEIEEIAKTPGLVYKLVKSLAPSVYGHDKIKEALLVQLVGGVKKRLEDGTLTRADMHILLIGDPGAAKSKLLKRINIVAPKSRFVSGKGVSGAGLTAAAVKDEFMGGWTLEAGAMVLANKGIICIDELDKMSESDTSAMHEALEGQTVTISKANIQADLRCETTVLSAANPKTGKFNLYGKSYAEQFGLPVTLINRFDFIFPIKDIPNTDNDEKLARFMSGSHRNGKIEGKNHQTKPKPKDEPKDKIETIMLRKYIAYAKSKTPEITEEAEEEYIKYYLKMRDSGIGNGADKSVPISARQLEALMRTAEAFAKIRLSDKVEKQDSKKAVDLMDFCLKQIAIDPETGTVDYDKISTGITSSERNRFVNMKKIISKLIDKHGSLIPIETIIEKAKKEGISEDKIDDVLEKLNRSGDIFEPKRGFISKI